MELTLDQALQKGIEAHKTGQIQDAEKLYAAILKAQPNHPDANHNMGVLAVGVGKIQEALPFFKIALEANPGTGQFWLSYINALIKLDRIADAKAVFDQAKDIGVNGEAFDLLESSLNQSNEIGESSELTQLIQQAICHREAGQFATAVKLLSDRLDEFSSSIELLSLLVHCCILNDDRENASIYLEKSKEIDAHNASVNWNDIRLLLKNKKVPKALTVARKAIEQYPEDVEGMGVIGACLRASNKVDESLLYLDRAILLNPHYAEALINRGLIKLTQKDKLGALSDLELAHKLKPHIKHIWDLVLNLYLEFNHFDQAITLLVKIVKSDPNNEKSFAQLALCYQKLGDQESAIVNYNKALKIKPDYAEAYHNLGLALTEGVFTKSDPDAQEVITSMLQSKKYINPHNISKAAISLLKFEPVIKDLFKKHAAGEVKQSLESLISNLSEIPLLLQLMSVCPIQDLELEAALVDVRSALLLCVSEISDSPEVLRFQSALALQCFTNEYVYNQSDQDIESLAELEVVVQGFFLKGEQPSIQSILCLATYKALHEYEWCDFLTVTTDIEEVFTRQIYEPREEGRLKANIPILQEITDKVSSKVREQYEANPYPRWVNLGLPLHPKTTPQLIKELNLRIFDSAANDRPAPNILIAGCGTGRHSIETASRFKDCNVLAVDLSLSSLAYAKRKTEELGLQNIEYIQADILDLGQLDKKFDIIESAGVLHHMDDPMAGWRLLTNYLESGGLMKIGLYSELARQPIVKVREEIKQLAIGSSDILMRSFRRDIFISDEPHHKMIAQKSDFYSLSVLRDLLFHVQEHRFKIPEIKDCLTELGLTFCGFESDKIVKNFKLTNTGIDDPYDLDKWDLYEQANPLSFVGMYQFWCQKVD